MNKFKAWFRGLSLLGRVTFISALLVVSFGVIGASAQPGSSTKAIPAVTATSPSDTTKTTKKNAPKIEIKSVVANEIIPYTSSKVNDNTLAQGVTQTQTKGVNGVLTHTYQVTYTDGVETNRSKPVDTVTTPAINEVIAVGTKAPVQASSYSNDCPNGTYINSAGNTVCRPYNSSSAPSGATARCSDGSYSLSQSRRGTLFASRRGCRVAIAYAGDSDN